VSIIVSELDGAAVAAQPVEIVERKGLGHPDTLCDALAEEVSLALSRFYLERFGFVLHHNVDKVLLRGGAARPAFAGGEVDEPIEVYLAGRATREYSGVKIPVDALAVGACRSWISAHMHALDAERHVRVHCLVRPGSGDLVELFERQRRAGAPRLANDTAMGVGFAPLTPLEGAVLAAILYAFVNTFVTTIYDGTLANIVGLLLMLIVLIVKPTGLFGAKERA